MTIKKTILLLVVILFVGTTARVLQAQEHAHESPHGGQVTTVGKYHYEMVVKPGEILIYVLGDNMKTLPLKGMEGTLLVQLPDKTRKTIKLETAGESFKAAFDAGSVESFIAIATIKIEGKSNVGRFTYQAKKHHDEKETEHEEHSH